REWTALETFGSVGSRHTPIFAAAVRQIDIWEIMPEAEAPLRQRFPDAGVKITDSYAEIARTTNKYDLVVVDHSAGVNLGHCDHFDLFPAIFGVLNQPGFLVLNVTPDIHHENKREWAAERKLHRQAFYQPQDPDHITFAEIRAAYARLAKANGKQ